MSIPTKQISMRYLTEFAAQPGLPFATLGLPTTIKMAITSVKNITGGLHRSLSPIQRSPPLTSPAVPTARRSSGPHRSSAPRFSLRVAAAVPTATASGLHRPSDTSYDQHATTTVAASQRKVVAGCAALPLAASQTWPIALAESFTRRSVRSRAIALQTHGRRRHVGARIPTR